MQKPLANVHVAILMTDGTDKTEFGTTRDALAAAGATISIVSPREHWVSGVADKARLMDFPGWGADVAVDVHLEDADAAKFDALFVPGGIVGPDLLRLQPKAASFVRAFFDARKPIGAICHGPSLFVDAARARHRRLTSWSSLKNDLVNAGARWEDAEVVVDGELVTSRSPKDLPAFTKALVEIFARKR
ncbi:MAG: type 1 glutamine amidotransferase domain-containing protein [Polyangia bacterium]